MRALPGGAQYYRKFLRDLSKRIRPISSLLRKGFKVEFTPALEVIVCEILAELAAPTILVFPKWDAVADSSGPSHVYCNAFIDGVGVALDQEQTDGSVRPIACISRASLDSERHWTPLDLEARRVLWAIKRLRSYLGGTSVRIFSSDQALESIGKVGDDNARVQWWLEVLTAFDYTLEYRKGSTNGDSDFLSRMQEPATEHDRSGSSSLIPVKDGGIFLIRACGLRTRASLSPSVCLSGLVPHSESAVSCGLPFASSEVRDFRTHGPRMRIDDLSAPCGRFVARVTTAVTTDDCRPGCGEFVLAADIAFASVFAVPSGGGTGSAEAPAAVTSVAQHAPPTSSTFSRLRRDH